MPAPPGSSDLTGATRYRSGWFGGLVLQVEERYVAYHQGRLSPYVERTPVHAAKWRDAKTRDIRTLDYLDRVAKADASGKPRPAPPNRF